MTRTYLAFVGVLVATTGLVAPSHAETLAEALAAAYNSNPTLAAQRASLRATDEKVPQALAGWRPTVTFTNTTTRTLSYDTSRTGERDQLRTPRTNALSLSQPIFTGLRTVAGTAEAENAVKSARAKLHAVEQTVLLDVATAYMNVVRDMAVLELNKNNEQVLRRQLQATRDRFEVGELTRTDVSQAEARLAKATADRIQSEGDLDATRAAYAKVVGKAPTQTEAPAALTDLPPEKDAVVQAAVGRHPKVVTVVYDEKSARDAVDGVFGELLPTVALSAKAERDKQTKAQESRYDELSAGLTVTVPLYEAGSVRSRLRQAKQTASQQRMNLDVARREAEETATKAWEARETARARIKSYVAQIAAAEVALDGVQREAQVGARTVLDVLDAEQELLNAKVSLVKAQRDEMVAMFQVKEAVGELTAERLKLPVDLYDPGQHYDEVRGAWFGTSSSGDMDDMDKAGKSDR